MLAVKNGPPDCTERLLTSLEFRVLTLKHILPGDG
jgi:hypothetical protein